LEAGVVDSRTGGPVDNDLVDLVGPFWSEAKVCTELSVMADTLAVWRAEGAILGPVTADSEPVYPVAQFHRHSGFVEVRPGLLPLLHTLRDYDSWAVAVLLNTAAPELGGVTTLEWVRDDGDLTALADYATVVAREWASGTR
jgi:hypothetical protein